MNFLFVFPAFYTIDGFGRRSLLLFTFPFLAFSHALVAIAFKYQGRARKGLAITGMYLFGIFYSPGEGPVPFVYAAEVMPIYIRDVGMGCVTSLSWLFNFVIAFTAPTLLHNKDFGAFTFYAICCVICWILIFL